MRFQFQHGAIMKKAFCSHFNFSVVRLKVHQVKSPSRQKPTFQFQSGTIKSIKL